MSDEISMSMKYVYICSLRIVINTVKNMIGIDRIFNLTSKLFLFLLILRARNFTFLKIFR